MPNIYTDTMERDAQQPAQLGMSVLASRIRSTAQRGEYDDWDDATLISRVLAKPDMVIAKFPEFADAIRAAASTRMATSGMPGMTPPSIAEQAQRNLRRIARGTDVPAGSLEPYRQERGITPMTPVGGGTGTNMWNAPDTFQERDTPLGRATTAANRVQGDLIKGAGKGAGNTAYHLGELVRGGLGLRSTDERSGQNPITEALTPHGVAEHIGHGVEQTAEFFVAPEAEAGAFGPLLARAGVDLSKAYKATKAGGRAMKLLPSMGVQGLAGAGTAAAQGGDPLTAGVGGVAGAVVSKVASKLAPKLVNLWLGKGSKPGISAGAGITEEGITALHLGHIDDLTEEARSLAAMKGRIPRAFGSLLEKTLRVRDEIGKRIGYTIYVAPKVGVDVEPAIDATIGKAIKSAKVLGDASELEKMRTAFYETLTERGISPNGVTPQELWALRDAVDDGINTWAHSESGTTKMEVARRFRDELSKILTNSVPELKALNRQYTNLSHAKDRIADRISGSSNGELRQYTGGMLRRAVNLATGYEVVQNLHDPIRLTALFAARMAAGSTPVITGGAQALRAAGSPAGLRTLSGLGAATGSEVGPGGQPEPLTDEERRRRDAFPPRLPLLLNEGYGVDPYPRP